MKFKICIILTIVFVMFNWNYKSFAKYIFKYEETIFELDIDRTLPKAEVIQITNTNAGYENYANKSHEILITIKVFDNHQLINNLKDFEIFVNTKESDCTKETKILEKTENYIIYQLKLTNILEEGELFIKIPENSFEDNSKNKMEECLLKTGIFIDNTAPVVNYSQTIKSNGKVVANLISNEEVRNLDGWLLDDTRKIHSKEFISDVSYHRNIIDLAGNISNVNIDVKDATYLGLEIKAHMSSSAWQTTESNIIGQMEKGNYKYKFESLLFRTGENVAKDYLQVSGYVHSHWGEGSTAIASQFKVPYYYGYNPISGYKTMENTELVNYNGKEYIHLGGEGINYQGNTDINGNHPIPVEIARQYKYGISGIKLDLKEHSENAIIYQIFFDDTGWLETCKNGEMAMRSETEPIEAMRVAVIPNSELEFVLREWNEDIGTYNFD